MRIFVSNANESWIVDRFRDEWYEHNNSISTDRILLSDIVWIIAPWNFKKINIPKIKNKKVVCTVHHIDEKSFLEKERKNFMILDKYVDEYHTISKNSYKQLKKLTNKRINVIPFWVDSNKWFPIEGKSNLRNKYELTENDYLIGSFQRDTEGKDLKSPKLIKGPDIFLELIKTQFLKRENLKIILTGKRRNYLINEFKKNNIEYKYFEMVNTETLNELYNILNLYIVSSRIEGGPQAILECSSAKIPLISTNVGIAPEILSKKSIIDLRNDFTAEPDIEFQYNKVLKYFIPDGMAPFIQMFRGLYES
tara:strand:+ start:4497 stop:5420 length:924 start_codon:yes stop_codon:yes gene_type:complete